MKHCYAPAALILTSLLMATSPLGATEDKVSKDSKDPKAGSAAGAKPSNELRFIPSTFVDSPTDPKFGKDIFFPKSTRCVPKQQDEGHSAPVSNETQLLKQLILKGISGNGRRRLAVVNNRTLAAGESWEYKLNGQTHRLKLEEIKQRSVMISIEGSTEKKELQLRDGL